ncbi:MAG: hypothetical protein FWH35_00235 [Treponema sp.]|nr:hypothetical protein [Treponema sp.]
MPKKNVKQAAKPPKKTVDEEPEGFTLIGGQLDGKIFHPTLVQIKKAIQALDTDKNDPFLILAVNPPINGADFIQIYKHIGAENGKFFYTTEIQFDFISNNEKWRQYGNEIDDINEVKKIFEDYFINKITPDVTGWDDIYQRVKNAKKHAGFFNIEEICSKYVRKNDNSIYNGHGIKHGAVISEKAIYQLMGEALSLMAELFDSDRKYGDVYFSNDKKRFYCNIIFPKTWPGRNRNIPQFAVSHIRDRFSISAISSGGKRVFLNIEPISTANRLLPCLILLVVEKLLSDEAYLETAIDYFLNANYANFIKLYKLVYTEFSFRKYWMVDNYDDDGEDESKFDLSDFSSFLFMCQTIMENKRIYNESLGLT